MSSIAGIVKYGGSPVEQSIIDAMLQAMAERGADAVSSHVDGAIGLGQSLLCTTPESVGEVLPFFDLASGMAIVADARLDNRRELGDALGCKREVAQGLPDSQLILTAYQKWGLQCASRLLGDFSFAIWDAPNGHLFCAVDPFSVKPFHYAVTSDGFVFASSHNGLKASGMVSSELNQSRFAALFVPDLVDVDWDGTLLRDARRLPAAHYLLVTAGKTVVTRYWDARDAPETRLGCDREYVEQFTALLSTAVSDRLRSHKAPVLSLSGGIDSNSVAALAIAAGVGGDQQLTSYSGIADVGTECCETELIHESMASLDCSSVTFNSGEVAGLKQNLLDFLYNSYYPAGISSIFLLCLFNRVARDGRQVMLDGMEGDMVMSLGGRYLGEVLKTQGLKACWQAAQLLARNTYGDASHARSLFLPAARSALLPDSLLRVGRWGKQRLPHEGGSRHLLTRQFKKDIDIDQGISLARHNRLALRGGSQTADHWAGLQPPWMTHMLYGMDMLSSWFGVEQRHPFLDRRLVEFSIGLPMDQLERDGWHKWILRHVDAPSIPEGVRWHAGGNHVGWQYHLLFYRLIGEELAAACNDQNHPVFDMVDRVSILKLHKYCCATEDFEAIGALMTFFGAYCWLTTNTGYR